jgi:hypothetical protein
LHVAAKKGHLEIVEYLINKGIDIDAKGGTFDASALNLAAGAGHFEIVKYLIVAGAELDVSLAKRNPLLGAIYGGHKEVVEFLVENGMEWIFQLDIRERVLRIWMHMNMLENLGKQKLLNI